MRHSVTITLPFVAGKARPKFSGRGGHTYTPKQTAAHMDAIRRAYEDATGERAPRGVAVSVAIVTTRPLPASRPKSQKSEPDTFKPDADNIAKLVLDGLSGAAFEDDRQITHLDVTKLDRYRDAPERMTINVRWTE